MNHETLEILESRLVLHHAVFDEVCAEVLRFVQYGRSQECICVIGPSAVGKTTMENYLKDYLITQQQNGWKKGCFPPLVIEAPTRDKSEFPWRSFLEDLLSLLGEDNLSSKVDLDLAEANRRDGRGPPSRSRLTIGQLESLVKKRIKVLKPVAIFIDECQNFVDGLSDSALKANMNRLKRWANIMDTKFIMFGTHESKAILNLNEQLARRVRPIYFPRYRKDDQDEAIEFARFYKSLITELDIKIDSKSHEDFSQIYNYTLGCPGLLASWLHDAIALCIDRNLTCISPKILRQTRMSSDRLATAEQAIKDFEAYYQDTLRDFDPNEIFPSEHQLDLVSPAFSREHKGNRGQRKRRPGVQKPRRYPVGGS